MSSFSNHRSFFPFLFGIDEEKDRHEEIHLFPFPLWISSHQERFPFTFALGGHSFQLMKSPMKGMGNGRSISPFQKEGESRSAALIAWASLPSHQPHHFFLERLVVTGLFSFHTTAHENSLEDYSGGGKENKIPVTER